MGNKSAAVADEIFQRLVKRRVPNVAVGLLQGDMTDVLAYKGEGAGAVSSDSLFEIGSITKTFTALLLTEMSKRGEVALEDPLSKFIPTVTAKRADGREITLLDLATHTSRLHGIPGSLWPDVLRNRADPYARFTVERLEKALGRVRMKRRIGKKFRYSNFGFATLGHALEKAAGASYEDLIRDRICKPLGLSSTRFEPPAETEPTFVQGHKRSGKPVPAWNLAAFAPAGALRSSVNDILRYVRSLIHPDETELEDALEEVQRRRLDITMGLLRVGAGRSAIGLSWLITTTKSGTLVWHNGGTGGFASFAGFHREAGVAVVALANGALYGPVTRAGLTALQRLCEGRP